MEVVKLYFDDERTNALGLREAVAAGGAGSATFFFLSSLRFVSSRHFRRPEAM